MHETDPRKAVNLLRRRLLKTPRDLDALVALSAYLADLGQDKEAETLARRAHRISPAAPEVLRVLGRLLQLQGRYDDALAIADAALAVNPALGAAWQMRGDALANAGRQREALEAYANALSDQATAFETFVRLGKIHRVLGETDQALASFDQAARLRPDSAVPPYERGLLRLANGDFADGWRDYDARWRTEELTHTRGYVPTQLIPLLRIAPTKADLVGQRVLLIGDQGIGDQVMFASMLPDLRRVAKSVVCLCEPRLMRVLGNAFPDISFVHPSGAQVDSDSVDVLLAMSSLGAAFRPTATDFPGKAYLKAQQDGASRWAARLGDRRAGLRIGLSWRGGVPQTGRAERSIDLAALRPLLETPGCEFVSLQYGQVGAEIEQVNAGLAAPIRHFPPEDLFDFQDFADLIENLDLVISVQNATVHLAGALGKPCLVLLPRNPEWRYMSSGSRLPWYDSVRLIRQAQPRDWEPVVAEAAELARTLAADALATGGRSIEGLWETRLD
jgi:Flp pilus assembly protein TadD